MSPQSTKPSTPVGQSQSPKSSHKKHGHRKHRAHRKHGRHKKRKKHSKSLDERKSSSDDISHSEELSQSVKWFHSRLMCVTLKHRQHTVLCLFNVHGISIFLISFCVLFESYPTVKLMGITWILLHNFSHTEKLSQIVKWFTAGVDVC